MIKDQVVRSPVVLALLVAAPVVAQIGPSGVASAIRTTATTRIEQPATLTSSQDLTFAPQVAIAATRATISAVSTASAASAASITTSTTTTAPFTVGAAASAATTEAASGPAGSGAGSSLRATTSALMAAPVAAAVPATFTVAGDSGQAISVTVPPTVELENGGGDGARLTTTSSLTEGPQFLGGSFAGGGTLSFAVGGQVMLASNNVVSTGTYNGVLMVVAQYN